MKAIVQDEYGSADVLGLEDVETPVAGRGEVLIRVIAASAFIRDRHLMTGAPYTIRLVSGLGKPKQRVRGQDVAGRISFQAGDGRAGRDGIGGVDRGSAETRRVSHHSWRNVQPKRGASVGLEPRTPPRLGCTGGSAPGCPSVDSWERSLVPWSEPWSDSSSSIAQRPSLRRSLHRRSLVWA